MTDQRLRELLEERVADTTTVDLASEAWERASAVRRRRRAVAGAAVAVVAIVGVTTVVVSGRGDEQPPPVTNTTETPVPARGPKAERGGKYGGVPVWWAPSTGEEAALPELNSTALPSEIDLSADEPMPPGRHAVGLFQRWGEEPGDVVVVGTDGASYSLDVDRLEPWSVGGEVRPPVTQESLSPDGRYAFFAQDRSLEIYDFEEATWTTLPTRRYASGGAEWSSDGSSIRVQNPLYSSIYYDLYAPDGRHLGNSRETTDTVSGPNEGDQVYGPTEWGAGGGGARGVFLAGPVAGPDGPFSTVDAVVVADGTFRLLGRMDGILAMLPEPGGGRWNQCCSPVGWLGPRTVLFESRHEDARILAWRVGTPEMWRVSAIRGWTPGEESYVASFADLRR